MKFFFLNFLFCAAAFGGTITLYNDSPIKLKAVIYAAGGTQVLGETKEMAPQEVISWSEWGSGNYLQSRTPYQVVWICPRGEVFSMAYQVGPGQTTAMQCTDGGLRACAPEKKKKSEEEQPAPPPRGEYPGLPERNVGPPEGYWKQ
jgi:hypothetical protein